MSDVVVRASGLVKSFGSHPALTGLDLEVRAGEVFGFIGPNGAGKTTTLRVLLDLVRPSAGTVEVFGVAPRVGGAALRQRTAYLPGDLRLHDRGRVRDVLSTFAALRATTTAQRAAMLRRADGVAERLGLELDRGVHTLSKGNRQKVGIALALMPAAQLLVLDEPTSGLDPLVQQVFLTMLREEREQGRTVLMSSHVLSEVQEVADRIGIIRSGRMVDVDDMATVRARASRVVQLQLPDADAAAAMAAELAAAVGVTGSVATGSTVRCSVTAGPDGGMPVLLAIAARHGVVDLLSHAPDLEELFLTYYDRPGVRAVSATATAGGQP